MSNWNRIVSRALTIEERIALGPEGRASARAEADAERRLAAWRQRAAPGDDAGFACRLRWAGLNESAALSLLTNASLPADAPPPAWVDPLRAATDRLGALVASPAPAAARRYLNPAQPLPFEEVLCPLVDAAGQNVADALGAAAHALDDLVASAVERQLLTVLSGLASPTLHIEFSVARAVTHGAPIANVFWFGSLPGEPGRTGYDAFVRGLHDDRLSDLFEQYPVLARLLGTAIGNWQGAISRFVSDLVTDLPLIEQVYGRGRAPGKVTGLALPLSDAHNGGRSVVGVAFESGLRLLYKPRNIDAEARYYELLAWCNERGLSLPFALFRTLTCGDHGWTEEVRAEPCGSAAEVERYYTRAGMLLCLIYVLEGADAHQENIVAHGEWPVLVDMEMLFHPRVSPAEDPANQGPANTAAVELFYWDSVFRTALLPRWEIGPHGESYDISGLGGVDRHPTHLRAPRWTHVNTDAMEVRWEVVETRGRQNVVRLGDQVVHPAAHAGEIVRGFCEMYAFLERHRDELRARGGVIDRLAASRMRALFRDTRVYQGVLAQMLHPANLRDGADLSIQAEALFRPFLFGERPPLLFPLAEEEVDALVSLDVPAFYFDPRERHLGLPSGGHVADVFVEASAEKVRGNLGRLCAQDRERQCQFIRSAFLGSRQSRSGSRRPASADETGSCEAGDLREAAREIGNAVAECAVVSGDGATWLSVAYFADAERWQLQPMTLRLYDGATGTALFLAALARTIGEERFRDLALAAVTPIQRQLATRFGRAVLFEPGIGAGLGATSVVYALVRMADWLDRADLLETASQVADLIDEGAIGADRRFDLLGGAAGAILALLSLHAATGNRRLLDRARACAEHLLESRTVFEDGRAAWVVGGVALGGFSHGAGGIAHALLRLAACTGEDRWRNAALDAIRYENGTYDVARNNWADLREKSTGGATVFRNSWCHGAAGVGLGRAGSLRPAGQTVAAGRTGGACASGGVRAPVLSLDDERLFRTDVDRAAARCLADMESLHEVDHPCCGNMGRAESLLEMGRRAGVPKWTDHARAFVERLVTRRRREGGFTLGWGDGPYIASFHQGMAGIGYALLRFADPDGLPCVLLWE